MKRLPPPEAPPLPRARLSLGVTGHRDANPTLQANKVRIAAALEAVLETIEAAALAAPAGLDIAPTRLHMLMADGADQLAARYALARGWELVAPLPFGHRLNMAVNAQPQTVDEARRLLAGAFPGESEAGARAAPVMGAVWTWGPLTVNLKESVYGPSSGWSSRTGCPLVFTPTTACFQTRIKTAALTDLEVAYKITESLKATVGANNLFNRYPDRINAFLRDDYLRNNSNAYVTQYPTFSPFGVNGGYYYTKLSLTF